jgi:cyanophycin synthetase
MSDTDVGAVQSKHQTDHHGLKALRTIEDLARVKRIVIEVAADHAVPEC